MIIYKALKDNMCMYINKKLISKYESLGYEIYEIDTESNEEKKHVLEDK